MDITLNSQSYPSAYRTLWEFRLCFMCRVELIARIIDVDDHIGAVSSDVNS